MQQAEIQDGKDYSNGLRSRKAVRVVHEMDEYVPTRDVSYVEFTELQDGPDAYVLSMPLREFAKWAKEDVDPALRKR